MNRYLCLGMVCLAALDAPDTHAQGVWETVVAANSGGDNLSVYRKNPATGALDALGAPVTVGQFPVRAAVHPSNRFLYVSNSGTISAFHIDGVTGSLTTVTGSPFSEGGDPEGLAMDPAGRFLYVADPLLEKIKGFHINRSTGALTPFASSFPVANNVFAVAIEPSGRFLYATTMGDGWFDYTGRIWGFSIDSTSGALTPLSGSPWVQGPGKGTFSLHVLSSGRFLYALNREADEVVGYAIDLPTGALSPVPGSPFATGDFPQYLTTTPNGSVLYVSNTYGDSVSAYSVSATTGALTPVPGSPFLAGTGSEDLYMDPSGQLLYVASAIGNHVVGYSVDPSTGALAQLASSPYAAGTNPWGMAGTNFGDIIFRDGFEGPPPVAGGEE